MRYWLSVEPHLPRPPFLTSATVFMLPQRRHYFTLRTQRWVEAVVSNEQNFGLGRHQRAMLAATAVFIVGDSFMKLVTEDLPPFETLLLRSIAASLACAVLITLREEWRVISGVFNGRAILQAFGETLCTLCYVVALARMQIADVIAILQTTPLLVMLGAALLLRERMGLVRGALALVGFAGALMAGFAKRLMLPVSKDTLLRVVRRRSRPPADPLRVIGIDDWAWRRNHRYASIICNLERRRVVTLLPDREPATAQAWLAAHPTIAIVARDRGGGYGEAAAKALPHAVQVADRWHLMENASRAFLDAVRKSMRQIRSAIGATTIDPKLLTAAERLQYEGYLRREETNAAILALSKGGTPIKQIVRQTGHSRKLVRQVIRGERTRCLPDPAEFARSAPAMARRSMGVRLPKRR